jgi:DNA adenine methylase
MKPFLKWVGGKQKFANVVLGKFPRQINAYYEPFLGGGSVLLALLESDIAAKKYKVNDLNALLIQTYVDVRDNVEALVVELQKLKNEKELYYEARVKFNDFKKTGTKNVETSALFIYLNKTGFRGLYREGPNGLNTPYGHYKSPKFFDEDVLRKCSLLIHNVEFYSMSYEDFLTDIGKDDFVYLDPPYASEHDKAFTKYNVSDFLDHDAFFDKTKTLPRFLMSNAAVTKVIDAFKGYDIERISCRRAINPKNPGATADEVLILK